MAGPIILFGNQPPDVFRLDQIYDPDIHGNNPDNSGLFVPAIGSVIVDTSVGFNEPIPIYIVVAVDPNTYKSTLKPATSILDIDSIPDRILSYGNDIYMLFYDDRNNPMALRIDSNLILFGNNAAEYKLLKRNDQGELNTISIYIDSNGQVVGDRVPIVETATPGIRRGVDCYTSTPLQDNDLVTMEVFDASGILIMTVELICKRATILNDLESSTDIITGFDARANQEKPTGEFILFAGQNKEDLAIFPEIEFSTGERLVVPIDNMKSFMYGWEEVKSLYPGMQYDILFKYYLADNVQSTIAQGEHVRFVTRTKTVVIEQLPQYGISKISVLPVFDSVNGIWTLRFYAYYNTRGGFEDVTSQVTYVNGTNFDGSLFDTMQQLSIEVPQQDSLGNTVTYHQDFCITLHAFGSPVNYTIQETPTSVLIYGADDAAHNRPLINYDSALEQYFISTTRFINTERFIENFYTNAEPPFLPPDETIAPTPTHFTIRELSSGRIILADAIPVDQYGQLFSLITDSTPDQFNNSDVVVEFLIQQGTGYKIIYGVPVEVRPGTYNT